MPKEYTYFAQAEEGGPIKIGYTTVDPQVRLKGLQTGSPLSLRIIASIPKNLEKQLHERFENLRLHGEWFQNDEALLAYIRQLEIKNDPMAVAASLTPSTLPRGRRNDSLFDLVFKTDENFYDFQNWVHSRDWGGSDWSTPDFDGDEDAQCSWYYEETPTGIMEEMAHIAAESKLVEEIWVCLDHYVVLFACGHCNSQYREDILLRLSSAAYGHDCTSTEPWQFIATAGLRGNYLALDLIMSYPGKYFMTFDPELLFEKLRDKPSR